MTNIKLLLPNIITGTRLMVGIFLVVYFVSFGSLVNRVYVLLIIFYAYISDRIDGYLARRFNVNSGFGTFFDAATDQALKWIILSLFLIYLDMNSIMIGSFFIKDLALIPLAVLLINKTGSGFPRFFVLIKDLLFYMSVIIYLAIESLGHIFFVILLILEYYSVISYYRYYKKLTNFNDKTWKL